MVTKNSNSEIANIKIKINHKLNIDFTLKQAKKIYIKKNEENFQKYIQKKFYDCLEIYFENFSFIFFFKMIFHYIFFPKVHIQSINLILNQVIEFYIKNIFIVNMEKNINILFKITEGKSDNHIISFKVISFINLLRNSKGKLNNLISKKTTKKNKLFSNNLTYEEFQEYIENIRIKLDCRKIENSFFTINQNLAKNCILSCYSTIRICFYYQIIRLFHFTQNFNLIIILYFNIVLDFFKNTIKKLEYPQDIFIIVIYLTLLEKLDKNFKLYYKIIFTIGKKCNLYSVYLLKNILNSKLNWTYFKNFIYPKICVLPIFFENSNYNILKQIKASYIKNSILLASTECNSLNIPYFSNLLEIDYKDTEHWLHELIISKKIEGKIDRNLGKVYFNVKF